MASSSASYVTVNGDLDHSPVAMHQLLQASRNPAIPQPNAGPTKLPDRCSLGLLDSPHFPQVARLPREWKTRVALWGVPMGRHGDIDLQRQHGLLSYEAPSRKLVDRYMCGAGHYETALRSSCDADVPAPGAGHTCSMHSNRRLLRANGPYRGDVGRDSMTVLAGQGGITLSCSLARRLEMDLCRE